MSHSTRATWALAVAALFTSLLLALDFAPASTASPSHEPTPHAGNAHKKARLLKRPSYWGAWIGDQLTGTIAPFDMTPVYRFQELVGKGMSVIEFSSPFADCAVSPCRPLQFPGTAMNNIREYGALPLLSWGSDSTPWDTYHPEQPDFQLSDIIAGAYDGYIREFAEDARAWGHPFFLRYDWEMNGNWFPWSERLPGNAPGEFVAAWRHVHDIFTSVGATNATWVWCPYADPSGKFGDLGSLYPGHGYVDWTCMDGYNWGRNSTNPHPWRGFSQIFDKTYSRILKVAPRKPMILAEMASSPNGGHKALWVRNMFKALPERYPRVRGLVWFDSQDRTVDWTVESSPTVLSAFKSGIRRPAFSANVYGQSARSPIPAPR